MNPRNCRRVTIGLVVEVRAARTRAEHPFIVCERRSCGRSAVGSALLLRIQFVPAAIEIQGPIAAHELEHRRIARVDERAFEIDLQILLRIAQQGLHGVRRLPQTFGREMVADAGGDGGVVEIEIPVHHVDVMHHQVGEDAAAEVPEPAPLAELVFVEGLVLRFAQPGFPVDVAGVQLIRRTHPAVVIAVPG